MTYQEAAAYIEEIPKFTKKHTLDHTKKFLDGLGNPEQGQKIIHVAGTNGKGSVCAYLRTMLEADGKTTGFFTSPHLVKVNERICLNGQPVSDERFTEVFEKVKNTVDRMGEDSFAHPSYFEFLFGMGMKVFQEEALDYIIMETGLGGRLDATNAVEHPEMTVITSISLDHTQYLGDTVSKIAAEKAGIIKAGVPVVFDGSEEAAAEVIRSRAFELGTECREITNHAFKIREITDKHIAFSRVNAYDDNIVWELSNSGVYQAMNASIAIAAMEKLQSGKVRPEQYERWKDALRQVHWDGRMEEIRPGIYLDGAHNPGAIQAFCDSIQALGEQEPSVVLFSAVEDKEYEIMIRELCRRVPAGIYVITEIADERGVPAEKLADLFRKYTDRPVCWDKDLRQAWDMAVERKGSGKMYCLGSLYLAGMIKREILFAPACAE